LNEIVERFTKNVVAKKKWSNSMPFSRKTLRYGSKYPISMDELK
jgi:hypothetical protein